MSQLGMPSSGLRERKKLRTRETIARVALDLFSRNGYHATTLAQIAEEAEIAPSTLHAYFPAKDDIIFSIHDEVRRSVKDRILDRPDGESVVEAMVSWIEDELPELAGVESEEAVRQRRAAIDGDGALTVAERMRHALLEDDFAVAFARDLGESPHDLRSRLLASMVAHALITIWTWWYQYADGGHDAKQLAKLDATYLVGLTTAAEKAIKALPSPPAHTRETRAR